MIKTTRKLLWSENFVFDLVSYRLRVSYSSYTRAVTEMQHWLIVAKSPKTQRGGDKGEGKMG